MHGSYCKSEEGRADSDGGHRLRSVIPARTAGTPLSGNVSQRTDGYSVRCKIWQTQSRAVFDGFEKGGIKADEAVVVENAPLGVEAGHNAGIFTIAVNTGPLNGQVLLDAGADLLFPSMQALNDTWDMMTENDI